MSSPLENRSSLFLLPAPSVAQRAADYLLQAAGAPEFAWEQALRRSNAGAIWRRDPGHSLAAAVNRTLAAGEARFFAERQALEALSLRVLPALMVRRRGCQRLKLWSAGCGTGQATYSLALALSELCPALWGWNLEIVATDADAAALTRASAGVYSSYEAQRGLPLDWLVRHFEQLPHGGGWRVNSGLALRITWLAPDRSGQVALSGPADVIFCHRPFRAEDVPTRRRELQWLTAHLASDGFLFLRSPDPALEREPGFERVAAGGPAIYRRVEREMSRLSA
jgi:chemotaxis protein methyltransferase CheR